MPQTVVLLETAEAIAQKASELMRVPLLPIDLESNGLHAYRASLCTLQIGLVEPGTLNVREVWVVDPIKAGNQALAPLIEVLGPNGPRKLVHDLAFDARILAQHGLKLGRVYDTSLAARFLGVKNHGLSTLVETHFGVKLSKALQHYDWGKRPLPSNTHSYLAADVAFLPALAERLEAEAQKRGLTEDIATETEFRLANALTAEVNDARPPYVRIKDAEKLGDVVGLAVLRRVAEVRESAAQRWDVPPFKVVGNEMLIELARKKPSTVGGVTSIPGLGRGRGAALAAELLDAVQRGIKEGAIPEDERLAHFTAPPKPPRELLLARRGRESKLTNWRRAEAAKRNVDEQAVLPGHCLQDIAERGPANLEELAQIPGLGAHRLERSGKQILEALKK
jgi:ribonuclease D